MSVEVRLKDCQAALLERGVSDVKFFFGAVSEKPLSQLASDAAVALEAVMANKFQDLASLGDSKREIK